MYAVHDSDAKPGFTMASITAIARGWGAGPTRFAPPDHPERISRVYAVARKFANEPLTSTIDLRQLEVDLSAPIVAPAAEPTMPAAGERLAAIADMLRDLTYGDMVELARQIWAAREGGGVTEKKLPAILHRWCHGEGRPE